MVTHAPPAERTNDAFYAIADPTRRSILDLVRERERSAGEIAEHFPVSRPAIAKHMRVLREAGLIRERRVATMRLYSTEVQALRCVDQWLAPYRLYWAARLVDLKRVVESQAQQPAQARPRRHKR
jgi:DNA-binding transcriptional ArsR family regulator